MTFTANASESARQSTRQGFTVVEVIVAVMILVLGLLAMAGIMGATTQLQQLTSSRAEITTLAETKIEELRAYGMTDSNDPLRATLAVGGSVATPTAGYTDTVANVRGKTYIRAWAISQDVVGTRRANIRVKPAIDGKNDIKSLDFSTLIWLR